MKPGALLLIQRLFFSATISLLMVSCNVIKTAEHHAIKKLNRKGIHHVELESPSELINGYHGGEGPNLLFVHGFGGDAQLSWRDMLSDFSPDYHVMAPDLLWFGKSHSTAKANLDAQINAVIKFVNYSTKSDTSSFSIIGHSYGGFVALGTYFKHAERVEKLVIVNSPGITYDTLLLEKLGRDAAVEHFTNLFVIEKPDDIERLNEMAFVDPIRIPFFLKETTYDYYFSQHHNELRSLLTSLPAAQKEFLDKQVLFPPSMVIWGAEDKIFPASEGKKLADYMKARFVLVPGAGHAAHLEKYDAFLAEINSFLAEK